MQFDRWGMQGAQPAVRSRSDEHAVMVRIENLVDREKIRTDHNDEIIEVEHPDLAFIAAAPSLVRELIAQVRTLLSAAEQGGKDRRELESLGRAYGKLASQLRSAAEEGERDREDAERWRAVESMLHVVSIGPSGPYYLTGDEVTMRFPGGSADFADAVRAARQPRQEGDR
jgi:hypothetical protein